MSSIVSSFAIGKGELIQARNWRHQRWRRSDNYGVGKGDLHWGLSGAPCTGLSTVAQHYEVQFHHHAKVPNNLKHPPVMTENPTGSRRFFGYTLTYWPSQYAQPWSLEEANVQKRVAGPVGGGIQLSRRGNGDHAGENIYCTFQSCIMYI